VEHLPDDIQFLFCINTLRQAKEAVNKEFTETLELGGMLNDDELQAHGLMIGVIHEASCMVYEAHGVLN
jgi:hypothetical protein